jgi:CMP-N-acetylneuraminic acid synthetase
VLEGELFRRQDAPKVFSINGSIYVYDRDFLETTEGLYCEQERVYIMYELYSIDIDREIDFQFIEFLLERGIFKFK